MNLRRGKKKFWLGAILGLIILVLAVSFAWWYFLPRKIVGDALADFSRRPGSDFKAVLNITNAAATQNLIGEEATVTLTLDGGYIKQADPPDSIGTKIDLTTETESVSIKVEGEARLVGDKAYLLVTKAPPIFVSLAALKGEWIELPRGGAPSETQLTPARELFGSVQHVGNDEINGQKVNIYQAEATPEAILLFMDNLARILGSSLTSEQIDQYRQGVAGVDKLPVNFAVTPWSRELKRLNAILTLPGRNEIKIELLLDELSTDRKIEPPENYIKLDAPAEAIESPSPDNSSPAPSPQTDAILDDSEEATVN